MVRCEAETSPTKNHDGTPRLGRRQWLKLAAAGSVGGAVMMGRSSPAFAVPQRAGGLVVTRVEKFKVVVPMKPGAYLGKDYGPLNERLAVFAKVPKYIIRLHTQSGLTGLGETGRGISGEAVTQNSNYLIGKDVVSLDFADDSLGLPNKRGSDAFEMAIYDLIGKELGAPVHMLLGGRFQDKIAITYWTRQRTESKLVAEANRAQELGFKSLKFKARVGYPVEKLVSAVVKATPDLTLMVDFDQSYPTVASFLSVGKRLEQYSNLHIEDPIPDRGDHVAWLSKLNKQVNIPFALTCQDPLSVMEAIRIDACEIFNFGGNMRRFVRLAYLAEAAGIPCWHGSGVELGIRDMSFIQAAAATRSCTWPSDMLSYLRQSELLANPWKVANGFVEVPREPGLGVELDEDAVRHYQVS